MSATDTDRIERQVSLNATRERVWRALTNAEEFGTWFGADLTGQRFAPGQRTHGHLTFAGNEHILFDAVVERIEPKSLMSFHWHPYPMEPHANCADEAPTLVTFTLHDGPANGTLLKVVESGFDKVPARRREEAFRMNSHGWDAQMAKIARHVGG